MNNITLTTIKLIVYPAQKASNQELLMPDAEWLRKTVNMLYNRKKESFRSAGLLVDLFHNHNEQSQQTIVRYPLIQYRAHCGELTVTGINEGCDVLLKMTDLYENAVFLNPDLYLKIDTGTTIRHEVCETNHNCRYLLKNYIPFSTDAYKEFNKLMYLKEKTDFIADKIESHIVKDFAKHLNIPVSGAKAQVVDVDSFNRPKVALQANKHRQTFQPFNVVFDACVDLPPGICLGNGKTYGYGCLERLS